MNMDIREAWENKKVRQGLLYAVGFAALYYIASSMGGDSDTDYSRLKAPSSAIFGISESTENMSASDAAKIVKKVNQEAAEKERDYELKEQARKKETAELLSKLSAMEGVVFELQQQVQGLQQLPTRQKYASQLEEKERGMLPGTNKQVEAVDGTPNVFRQQQTNIITKAPKIDKHVIRTITQRTIRTTKETGIIEEESVRTTTKKSTAPLTNKGSSNQSVEKKPDTKRVGSDDGEFTLTMGSIISGVTLSGVAAPTGIGKENNPIPITLRVKKEAVMPNFFSLDIRDCHLLGSAIGELSSMRVKIRAEAISCITEDGQAIEKNITAYAVSSSDGMEGIKGTLVSRSGEMISNTLVAGTISGIAKAVAPQQIQSLNTVPTASTVWQKQNLDRYAGAGMLQGSSEATQRLADYYMSMADATWPVLELLPGISVDFIVQRGMTLQLETPEVINEQLESED